MSGYGYKAVDHTLAARLLEINLQLVAVNCRNRSIAEFFMKHAQANRQVAARLRTDRCG